MANRVYSSEKKCCRIIKISWKLKPIVNFASSFTFLVRGPCYAMLCYARMAQHIFYFSFFCSWSSFRLIEFTPTFFFLLLEDFCLVYNCSLLTFKLLFYLINIHKSLLGIKTDFCYFTNKHFETILEQNCFLISSK